MSTEEMRKGSQDQNIFMKYVSVKFKERIQVSMQQCHGTLS